MSDDIHIEEATSASDELVAALARLVPQLTSKSPPPDRKQLESLLRSDSSTVLIARLANSQGPIVGAACLGVYRVLTGLRAVIEDVVVDESARGKGIGEALVQRLLEMARSKGARGVSLTSNTNLKDTCSSEYRELFME